MNAYGKLAIGAGLAVAALAVYHFAKPRFASASAGASQATGANVPSSESPAAWPKPPPTGNPIIDDMNNAMWLAQSIARGS